MSRLETDGPGDESEAVSRYLGSSLFEVTFQSIPAVMTLVDIDGVSWLDHGRSTWAIIEQRAHQLVLPQFRVSLLLTDPSNIHTTPMCGHSFAN